MGRLFHGQAQLFFDQSFDHQDNKATSSGAPLPLTGFILTVYYTVRMKPVQSKLSDRQERSRRKYEQLKQRLLGIGPICLGSIVRRWMSCGKKECVCHDDPDKGHGPYYQWTRKIRSRTESRMIPEALIRLYREGIRNHRRVDQILELMREVSLRAFDAQKKSSKRVTPIRGKHD